MKDDRDPCSSQSLSGFSFSVAGISLKIHTQEARIRDYVLNRYQKSVRKLDADFCLSIEKSTRGSDTDLMSTRLLYESSRIELIDENGGIRGSIDFQERTARLLTQQETAADDIEYILRVIYAYLLLEVGGLLFHAAGIERDGYADIFFGKSGIGKTTVARASGGYRVLNDDLVAIVPDGGHWSVCGTPFWNPTQVAPGQQCAPLSGLYRLVQDTTVYLKHLSNAVALGEVVANAPIVSGDPFRSEALLVRCQELIRAVPVQELHFLPDDSFWPVVLNDRARRMQDYLFSNQN